MKKQNQLLLFAVAVDPTGNLHLVNGHFPYSVGDFVSRCGGLWSVSQPERIMEKITLSFGVS
jgi:hypothetical protein